MLAPNILTAKCHPEELKYSGKFSSILRQQEFLRSRYLLHLDIPLHLGPLLNSELGQIVWPRGYCGSLSHKDSEIICVTEKTTRIRSIGIDLESLSPSKNDLSHRICNPEEIALLNRLDAEIQESLKVVFSLKESLFKAIFPLCLQRFYFLDAEIVSIDFGANASESIGTADLILRKTLNNEWEKGHKFSANFIILKEENLISSLVAIT